MLNLIIRALFLYMKINKFWYMGLKAQHVVNTQTVVLIFFFYHFITHFQHYTSFVDHTEVYFTVLALLPKTSENEGFQKLNVHLKS